MKKISKAPKPRLDNMSIADLLDELADLLDLTGDNPFRIRAYRTASQAVRALPNPVSNFAQDSKYRLSELPGIGKDLEEKILDLAANGSLPLLAELRKKVPASIRSLMKVPGLGPRKIMQLHRQLKLGTLDDLRAAILDKRVEKLPGFGPKSAANILSSLAMFDKVSGRIPISTARRIAESLTNHLNAAPGIRQLEIAGSYRRGKETVGDLDILTVTSNKKALMDRLSQYVEIARVEARGPTRMTVRLHSGLQFDLRVVPPESWGAALVYFTGSKAHNIALRRRAQQRGLKINEYGVFKGAKRIAGKTEEDVYTSVGLQWIPPNQREMPSDDPKV